MTRRYRPYYWCWNKATNEVTPCPLLAWAAQMQDVESRRVAADELAKPAVLGDGTILISTVFLGLDHNFSDQGPPIIWETLILGLPESAALHEKMWRYANHDDAVRGHGVAVRLVQLFLSTVQKGGC